MLKYGHVFLLICSIIVVGCLKVTNFEKDEEKRLIIKELRGKIKFAESQNQEVINCKYNSEKIMIYGITDPDQQSQICTTIQEIRKDNNLKAVYVEFWEGEKVLQSSEADNIQGTIEKKDISLLKKVKLE